MGLTGISVLLLSNVMFQMCVLLTENVNKTADPKLTVSGCHASMVILLLVTNTVLQQNREEGAVMLLPPFDRL